MIQPKASRIRMSFDFSLIFSLQSVQSHNINKVALSRFSVVSIDDCPLGAVYFVHHNARLPLTGSP